MAALNIKFKRIIRKYEFLLQELEDCTEMLSSATRTFNEALSNTEEKEFYDQWAYQTDKHLVFNFHTIVNCGSSCVRSHVFTYSINNRTLEHAFWGRTITEAHYPSNWFVGNLTSEEAKVYNEYK